MGKNYYLSKGYYLDDFQNVQLTEIFKDMKSLEEIDMYTSKFRDFSALREELLKQGLIRSNEGIVIGCYKTNKETKEKRLVPIFQRKMIFSRDLEKLGFNGKNYLELAKEVKDYVYKRVNNFDFMKYVMDHYYQKYSSSKVKVKAPIYESGDISILKRIVDNPTDDKRDEQEYSVSFRNFFMNEIYKCERVYEPISFDGIDRENVLIFKPIDGKVNVKGLHDLLCHIIDYAMQYELCYEEDEYIVENRKETTHEQISLDDYDYEEFLEDRDFERPLKEYAKEVDLDIFDSEAVEKDDYANSFVLDQHRLVKK